MKLLRYGESHAEKWGVLDTAGEIRALEDALATITHAVLSPGWMSALESLDPATLPLVKTKPRIGAPVPRPVNFVCIGLNYADHAAETGGKIPKEPIIFLKSLSAFSGPFDDIIIPRGSVKTDWEVELGVIIGTKAAYVSEEAALDYVAGYCTVNDISEREYQMERSGTWDKGKGCDTFGPVGPYLVAKSAVPDPQNLDLWAEVDGKRMQSGNTKTMVFGVRKLVSYVSQFITLHPGDIIATGTPPGVGLGVKPHPVFLHAGQEMRVSVQGMGEHIYKTITA